MITFKKKKTVSLVHDRSKWLSCFSGILVTLVPVAASA